MELINNKKSSSKQKKSKKSCTIQIKNALEEIAGSSQETTRATETKQHRKKQLKFV
jgi:hypothetical protein